VILQLLAYQVGLQQVVEQLRLELGRQWVRFLPEVLARQQPFSSVRCNHGKYHQRQKPYFLN
jgi:hypothetical protein